MTWNAEHYLKFDDQRTRAAADLAARIRLDHPGQIVDLGCGPGNSTQVLSQRWPDAAVLGVDRSPEMINAAKSKFPDQAWQVADAATWTTTPVDLLYANAALHWLPNHAILIPKLMKFVATGGAMAFQIPSSTYPAVRDHIHEISRQPKWTDRLETARDALTMHPPSFYYDTLVSTASNLDIWETEYQHVLPTRGAIIDWIASTGLRPFLAALESDSERRSFLDQLSDRVDQSYPSRADGKVLFPFRRTFVIAYH